MSEEVNPSFVESVKEGLEYQQMMDKAYKEFKPSRSPRSIVIDIELSENAKQQIAILDRICGDSAELAAKLTALEVAIDEVLRSVDELIFNSDDWLYKSDEFQLKRMLPDRFVQAMNQLAKLRQSQETEEDFSDD